MNKELARGIQSKLKDEFGADSVFLDIEDIGGGEEWKQKLIHVLEDDPIVVTLVTTKWNSRRQGKPKLMHKEDHVRFELETAISRGLPVVPVLYEKANIPNTERLPKSLHPLLSFQTLPFSSSRWDYDSDQLVTALKKLLEEKSDDETVKSKAVKKKKERKPKKETQPPKKKVKSKKKKVTPQEDKTPPVLKFENLSVQRPDPTTFTRSMFSLDPEQVKKYRKEAEERAKKENKRLEKARNNSTAYYKLPAYWFSIILTFALVAATMYGSEVLARWTGSVWEKEMPKAPLIVAYILIILWTATYIFHGIRAYKYDPEEGSRVFYTHSILGGWNLAIDDWEPIGYWGAFPIATAVLWFVSRIAAMSAFVYLSWNYLLVFCIVISVYTVPVVLLYLYSVDEETYIFN